MSSLQFKPVLHCCTLTVTITLTLTCDIETPKTMSLIGYRKVIPQTKFGHFGIIRFGVMLQTNKQTNKQTDRQTDGLQRHDLPTPTVRVAVRNYNQIQQ